MTEYHIAVHLPGSRVVTRHEGFWFTSRLSTCKTVLKPVQGRTKRMSCHCGELMLMRYEAA